MDNIEQIKIIKSFNNNILYIYFVEGTLIEVADLIPLYQYGLSQSKGKPYCTLFDYCHYSIPILQQGHESLRSGKFSKRKEVPGYKIAIR